MSKAKKEVLPGGVAEVEALPEPILVRVLRDFLFEGVAYAANSLVCLQEKSSQLLKQLGQVDDDSDAVAYVLNTLEIEPVLHVGIDQFDPQVAE